MYRQEKLLAGALLLLVSLSNPAGATTVRFRPGVTYRVGTAPRAVVAADFNGDGKQDLAVVNAGNAGAGDDGSVSILLGNGDGTFQSASNIPGGKNPVSIAVGDFNGDGRPDLAVGDAGDGGSISILLGNGDGTFERAESVGLEGAAFSLAVGDFDGDLRTDLVVLQVPSSAKLTVFFGNGDGTFARGSDVLTDIAVGFNLGVLVADFNGDHKLDLVISGSGGAILLGNGNGTFQPALGVGVVSTSAAPTSVGDFSGDSRLDLVMEITRFRGESFDVLLQVLLGNGDGTFQAAKDIFDIPGVTFQHTLFAATGDFNGDKNLDIAVTERSTDPTFVKRTVDVFLGNGDGTFQPATSFGTNSSPASVSVANLNADQSPDLITVNPDDNTIGVLLNTTGADFSISSSAPTPGIISRGQSSTSTVTLSSLNAFNNPVALTCSVQPTPSAPICSLNPNSVTFDANGNATATLTMSTGAASASLSPSSLHHNARPFQFLWLPVAGFALMGTGFGSSRSVRRKLTVYLLGGTLFAALTLQVACGGGSSGSSSSTGPQSTAYTVTVTGTSGLTTHSATVTLAVR